jgi:hypothetical protein
VPAQPTANGYSFVDADTTINSRALASALRAMERVCGGGLGAKWVSKDESIPLYARLLLIFLAFAPKLVGFTAALSLFCTRDAFHGRRRFDERLHWAEEGGLPSR